MTQAVECHGLPQRAARGTEGAARGTEGAARGTEGAARATGWLGRLRTRLFGSRDRKDLADFRHCSEHMLRDIGLLDDRRGNRLLRDHVLFRL